LAEIITYLSFKKNNIGEKIKVLSINDNYNMYTIFERLLEVDIKIKKGYLTCIVQGIKL